MVVLSAGIQALPRQSEGADLSRPAEALDPGGEIIPESRARSFRNGGRDHPESAPEGERNGNYRHGARVKEAIELRKLIQALVGKSR